VFIDQRYGLPAPGVLGPQLVGLIHRIPVLDSSVWIGLLLVYIYFIATLLKLRSRLRHREAGSHEKVAAV